MSLALIDHAELKLHGNVSRESVGERNKTLSCYRDPPRRINRHLPAEGRNVAERVHASEGRGFDGIEEIFGIVRFNARPGANVPVETGDHGAAERPGVSWLARVFGVFCVE